LPETGFLFLRRKIEMEERYNFREVEKKMAGILEGK